MRLLSYTFRNLKSVVRIPFEALANVRFSCTSMLPCVERGIAAGRFLFQTVALILYKQDSEIRQR